MAVVEPDSELALALRIRLSGCGMDVRLIDPGPHAARAIIQFRPHLLLLDIDAERFPGFELHGCLLTSERTRRIPVIYLTTRDHRTHRELAARYGACAMLVRPFEHQHLMNVVADLVPGLSPPDWSDLWPTDRPDPGGH